MVIRSGIRMEIWIVQKTSPLTKPTPAEPAGSIHAKRITSAKELKKKYSSTDTPPASNQRFALIVTSFTMEVYHSCISFATDAISQPFVYLRLVSSGRWHYCDKRYRCNVYLYKDEV